RAPNRELSLASYETKVLSERQLWTIFGVFHPPQETIPSLALSRNFPTFSFFVSSGRAATIAYNRICATGDAKEKKMSRGQATVEAGALTKEKREQIFDAFRRWGYLQADLDPLGDLRPVDLPELQLTGEIADAAR